MKQWGTLQRTQHQSYCPTISRGRPEGVEGRPWLTFWLCCCVVVIAVIRALEARYTVHRQIFLFGQSTLFHWAQKHPRVLQSVKHWPPHKKHLRQPRERYALSVVMRLASTHEYPSASNCAVLPTEFSRNLHRRPLLCQLRTCAVSSVGDRRRNQSRPSMRNSGKQKTILLGPSKKSKFCGISSEFRSNS